MSLQKDDIQKIAHLARLGLSEDEINHLAPELSRILDLVAHMNALNTQDIEPMAHPLDMQQRLRPDEVTESNQRELYQSIAPAVENGLYLVPKVIE